ncbi:receptor-like protein EIX1 [Zingiber officinale]|nr:receptor-like protein EIX1 [Zingiber officinale]
MEASSICKGSSNSPKHSALIFIIFLLSIRAYCNDSLQATEESSCLENERSALLAIKSDMYDPGDWFSSWIGRDCCKWRGVGCDNITGHVTELDLHSPYPYYVYEEDPILYQMDSFSPGRIGASKLNPSLEELKHLKYLDLSMNNFSFAHIPNMIASLVHLEYLNLSRTLFCGLVPPQFGNLSSLRYLDLNGCVNSLYYTFKSCIRAGGLQWLSPSLEYLDMSCVDLSRATNWLQEINSLGTFQVLNLGNAELPPVTSPLPSFNLTSISQLSLFHYQNFTNAMLNWLSNASNLRYLDLRKCYSGLHVEQLQVSFSALPNLKKLEIASNLIKGEISGILSNISTRLQYLDLSGNEVSGEIADILWNLRHLEYLNLDSTYVRGYLPHVMENLTRIRHLSVSNTHIAGHIPETVGKLVNLRFLDLSHNNVTGVIPWSMGNLTNLVVLYLGKSNLTGSIPETFGNLTNLELLFLYDSNVSGQVPESIGKLQKLRALNLENNLLIGQIPESIGGLYNLEILNIPENNLIGQIPESIGGLANLEILDISENNLLGQIPRTFGNLCNLIDLDLSHNSIGRELTDLIDGLSNCTKGSLLRVLYLDGNNLSGLIPPSVGQLHQLEELSLPHNSFQRLTGSHLQGNLSPFFCSTKLQVLDLSSNELSGEVPKCPDQFPTSLVSLHLNDNSLSGTFPTFLKNSKELVILDLGENKFSGEIPMWIAQSLASLKILRLHSNLLHGTIPTAIASIKSLQLLDLSSNRLHGNIPSSLGNLSAMAVIFSSDSLYHDSHYDETLIITAKGSSYEYTDELRLVRSMDLSNNNLSGEIPNELTYLLGLHFLNLSMNHLTGRIPEKIGGMSQLESLDLSMNNLTGEVPASLSALSFLGYLNLSYNNLSGRIPESTQLSTFNASIYAGNEGLCGSPLPQCSSHATFQVPSEQTQADKIGRVIQYSSITIGFIVGFWGFIGIMILKKEVRVSLFQWLDKTCDHIYVQLALKLKKVKPLHEEEN